MLGVAVGGAEEALFDWDYQPHWNRKGFAKLAVNTGKLGGHFKSIYLDSRYEISTYCNAGAPIIPIFTENIREAFDTISTGAELWKKGWELTHKISPPVVGGWPVRLTTHVGDKINVRDGETVDQLKERVEAAMKEMIDSHQVKTGGVKRAVLERLRTNKSTGL